LEAFLKEVDVPVAQVLFEVLVVDYNTTDRAELGITANDFGGDSGRPGQTYFPFIDINQTGAESNATLRSLERRLGFGNLGTLSDNFFIRLRALVSEGKANIRSQPQIASLNGNPASIKVGTTQYFLLKSETIYNNNNSNPTTQTSERFEKIEADLSLEVIPFVSPNRDLIVEVKPQFNTPVGSFDPDTPPTINRRELRSLVRLRDGETIVLGGLVETSETASIEKVPILGSIPILGLLFQNRTKTARQSDLIIYITPHVYYGSEGSVNLDEELKKK
jgi:type IV pilus assembly protein PilQ